MDKKVLAKKAPIGYFIYIFILLFMIILVTSLMIISKEDFMLFWPLTVALVIFAIVIIYNIILNWAYPNIMLYYDENGIYLNFNKNEFISFKEITEIKYYNTGLRGFDFKFGGLAIITNKTSFKTPILKDIREVEYIIRKNVDKVNGKY